MSLDNNCIDGMKEFVDLIYNSARPSRALVTGRSSRCSHSTRSRLGSGARLQLLESVLMLSSLRAVEVDRFLMRTEDLLLVSSRANIMGIVNKIPATTAYSSQLSPEIHNLFMACSLSHNLIHKSCLDASQSVPFVVFTTAFSIPTTLVSHKNQSNCPIGR